MVVGKQSAKRENLPTKAVINVSAVNYDVYKESCFFTLACYFQNGSDGHDPKTKNNFIIILCMCPFNIKLLKTTWCKALY